MAKLHNQTILDDIAQEHGDVHYQGSYQVWVFNQDTQEITHQFHSDKDSLEEALEDTFQEWKTLYPQSNFEDWEDFQDNTDNEELYIHASHYGIIYQ